MDKRNGKDTYDVGLDPMLRTVPPPGYIGGHVSMYNESDQSHLQPRDDVSESDTERRLVKRKVLR